MAEEKQETPECSIVVKKPVDLQRMKLEKLMRNPVKPAFIPEMQKDKKFPDAPEFVRNVMGSSAGAGSGEFHVYRHIRRREYARNLYLQKAKEKNVLDEEYHKKLEQNRRQAEEKTAKKRVKRQKFKMKKKAKRQQLRMKNKDANKQQSHSENSEGEGSDNSEEKSIEWNER